MEAMKWLKEQGANVDATNLQAAVYGRESEWYDWYREQNNNPDQNRMPPAGDGKYLNAMKWLKEQGVAIDTTDSVPIRMAAAAGDVEMMKWLMEQGVDINVPGGGNAYTAIQEAAYKGNVEVVKWMVANGADIHVKAPHENIKGHAAVHIAAKCGHLDLLKYLKEQGADINAICVWSSPKTPLDFAIEETHRGVNTPDDRRRYEAANAVVEWLKDNGGKRASEFK